MLRKPSNDVVFNLYGVVQCGFVGRLWSARFFCTMLVHCERSGGPGSVFQEEAVNLLWSAWWFCFLRRSHSAALRPEGRASEEHPSEPMTCGSRATRFRSMRLLSAPTFASSSGLKASCSKTGRAEDSPVPDLQLGFRFSVP